MAGEWIKMRADLHDDPAVFRLASMLKIDKYAVIGRLHTFWSWADRHSVDGFVDGAASTYVDEIVRCDGFAESLAKVGWLEIIDEGIRIPKFDRHNGDSAKQRAQKNERQARWRAQKDADVDGDVDASVDGSASTATSTREEKRREEKKKRIPNAPRSRSSKTAMPEDFGISEQVEAWAAEKGFDFLDEHLSSFRRKVAANGYKYVDWDSAFMEAIRSDWAKINNRPKGNTSGLVL